MSEESRVDRAFETHDAFEHRENDVAATATPFDATATAEPEDDPTTYEVRVDLAAIDAVVEGEVGDAVAEGWYETLSLRLEDAYDVTRGTDGDVEVWRRADTVTVALSFVGENPDRAVDDAAALVDYVEGTYVQGVIPGYEYTDPVAGLIADARQNARDGR
jgi:hypothetical protein